MELHSTRLVISLCALGRPVLTTVRTGYARRTASLGYRCHPHSRIRHLLVYSDLLHNAIPDRMLWDPNHQFRVLHSDSAGVLFDMPTVGSWDQSLHGTCGDQKSLDLFIGVFNLLMDIATVVLPMPVLWGLQMPTWRKVALSGMFSMGTV